MMMLLPRFATTTSLRLLLFALAVSDTSAVFCNFINDDYPSADHAVSSQYGVDERFAGCTEIHGTLYIAANYTGRLYLPNVTDITGGVSNIYDSGYHTPIPAPYISSIELPDLNHSGSININGAPELTTVSFPSLTTVDGYIFLNGIYGSAVEFPSLKTTMDLRVTGNPKSLNFPLLVSGGDVRVSRKFYSSEDVSFRNYLLVDRVDNNPWNISFPALQNATSVYIQGNISSMSMPQLSTMLANDFSDDTCNIRILTYGNPLNISLPSLSQAAGISVAGTIGSTHFPLLRKLNIFELSTSTPLDVSLEPIKAISQSLSLSGNITTVSMSSITEPNSLEIHSEIEGFNCSAIFRYYTSLTGIENPSEAVCSGPIHPPKSPKSKTPMKLGLAIGLGVPVFLALVYYMYLGIRKCHKTRKDQKSMCNTAPGYELGVPPTYTTEGPPAYDASEEERRQHGVVDLAGARSGDASSVRGEGASESSASSARDAASARPGDGNSAYQEGALGRRLV